MKRASYARAGLTCMAVLFVGCNTGRDETKREDVQRAVNPPRLELRGAPQVRCAQRNEAPGMLDEPGPADIRLGPLRLQRAADLATLNPSEFYPKPGKQWGYHKVGVAVAADARVTLATDPTARERFGLFYAKPEPSPPFTVRNGGAAVRFSGCAASEPLHSKVGTVGDWTHFGGELLFTGPGCYQLIAHDTRRREWHSAVLRLGAVAC